MSLEFIANNNMSFKFINPAHSGSIVIVTPPSTKVKAGGVGVHINNMAIVITGGTDGMVTAASGSGTFPATASKVKADGALVLRKGDQSIDIVMTGVNPDSSPGTYTTKVEIDDPGQDKVKAA